MDASLRLVRSCRSRSAILCLSTEGMWKEIYIVVEDAERAIVNGSVNGAKVWFVLSHTEYEKRLGNELRRADAKFEASGVKSSIC